jgi:hypothetical protein
MILPFFIFFSCSDEKAIEDVIDTFESSIQTNDNFSTFQSTISEESDFLITGPVTLNEFYEYLSVDFDPISYSGLSIDVDGDSAVVTADALYSAFDPIYVEFVMRQSGGFFSFLNPDWGVKEYWDTNNPGETLEYYWLKMQERYLLEQLHHSQLLSLSISDTSAEKRVTTSWFVF